MRGWTGKLLRVNLSEMKWAFEEISPEVLKRFVGGRGLGTKILWDEKVSKADPLSPENKIIFATGPLTGTGAPAGSRYMVVTKGALTGAIAASNSGGHWPAELKIAGYDAIIVEGRAEKPCYIWVSNEKVEIRDAGHIWGKTTWEIDDIIKKETDPQAKIAAIGPAGENLVRFACVINDMHRAAGRSGVGAVMGSKKLKAIVVRGSRGVKVANPTAFRETCLKILSKLKDSPITGAGLPAYGTAILVNIINEAGVFPTRNFTTSQFEEAGKISGETLAQTYLVRNKACFACPISCGRVTHIPNEPRYPGAYEGPEYETIWALGASCGVGDLAAISKANFICNEMGMDAISVGATIACAMEMYERGYITLKETGIPLNFGNARSMVAMVEKIAHREGFGNELAEGSQRFAQKFGYPEFFMGAKGQEFPAYDPRGAQAIGLNYATANRGGCHVRGYTIAAEILGIPVSVDRFATENKAILVKAFQDLTALVDSSGICLFTVFTLGAEDICELLESATGERFTVEEGLKAGERIWNLERLFNLDAGFTSADDTLPPRLLKEPIPAGPSKGHVNRLYEMLPDYYRVRGWDEKGVPTPAKLAELGL